MQTSDYIPTPDPRYIPFGVYARVRRAVEHPGFLCVYVSGEAGNGKTQAIVQAHAAAQRPLIRVNLSEQSDESLLISTTLVDGDTVDRLGPVALAARHGWSVLLDEFDCAGPLVMALQAALEGQPFTLPRTGERITPAPGFKVFLTGNTTGRGSDRYINTRPLNEATLDRVSFLLMQHYPDPLTEARILAARLPKDHPLSPDLPAALATWAAAIRDAHREGRVDDTMTTRRLLHLVDSLPIFDWLTTEALTATVSRFGPVTAEAMVRFWTEAVAGDAALTAPGHAPQPAHTPAAPVTAPTADPDPDTEFI